MRESDQQRLREALAFALEHHGEQTRKGSAVPYSSHLLQVSGLVLEAGGDATQAVAALLHDTLEDCESVDLGLLRERFGDAVARIVEHASDLLPGDTPQAKSSWAERKCRYLDRMARGEARSRLVAACDKLHNLRSLVSDLRAEGPATLERFNAPPAQLRWYYESAHAVLGETLPDPLRGEFDALIAALAGFVPEAEPPPR